MSSKMGQGIGVPFFDRRGVAPTVPLQPGYYVTARPTQDVPPPIEGAGWVAVPVNLSDGTWPDHATAAPPAAVAYYTSLLVLAAPVSPATVRLAVQTREPTPQAALYWDGAQWLPATVIPSVVLHGDVAIIDDFSRPTLIANRSIWAWPIREDGTLDGVSLKAFDFGVFDGGGNRL